MTFKLDGYVTVNQRLTEALQRWPELRVVEANPKVVTVGDATFIEVTITVFRDPADTLPCTAAAWEPIPGRTPYTKDSEMMNASTSALGRALGLMGIGTAGSISSADEVITRRYDQGAQDHPSTRATPGEAATRPLKAVKAETGTDTAGKRSTPTDKMANFLRVLEGKTGERADPAAFEDFDLCRSEIDRLQGLDA